MTSFKRPVSVLVVIHTPDLSVLLLERAAHPGYWQSVTGSQEGTESLPDTARREVEEETGIAVASSMLCDWQLSNTYEIFPEWRHRYAPGVVSNTEHVFSLQIAKGSEIRIAPGEHRDFCWLHWPIAASRCFSWSNRDAILSLPERVSR